MSQGIQKVPSFLSDTICEFQQHSYKNYFLSHREILTVETWSDVGERKVAFRVYVQDIAPECGPELLESWQIICLTPTCWAGYIIFLCSVLLMTWGSSSYLKMLALMIE